MWISSEMSCLICKIKSVYNILETVVYTYLQASLTTVTTSAFYKFSLGFINTATFPQSHWGAAVQTAGGVSSLVVPSMLSQDFIPHSESPAHWGTSDTWSWGLWWPLWPARRGAGCRWTPLWLWEESAINWCTRRLQEYHLQSRHLLYISPLYILKKNDPKSCVKNNTIILPNSHPADWAGVAIENESLWFKQQFYIQLFGRAAAGQHISPCKTSLCHLTLWPLHGLNKHLLISEIKRCRAMLFTNITYLQHFNLHTCVMLCTWAEGLTDEMVSQSGQLHHILQVIMTDHFPAACVHATVHYLCNICPWGEQHRAQTTGRWRTQLHRHPLTFTFMLMLHLKSQNWHYIYESGLTTFINVMSILYWNPVYRATF